MAGSYNHCRDNNTAQFDMELIENMGDAHEALEEMFDMIEYLSKGDEFLIEAARHYHLRKRYSHHVSGCELCRQLAKNSRPT